ncbi:hypothetical protein ACX80R_17770 [Paeniglutamicibacter antarcticus]|uniref:TetR family transcriptional regulator n=2 Tax=Paeniglutamicibacter antarcticus TaxID=494023 RepID=A0ABP9TGQ3_9MICC
MQGHAEGEHDQIHAAILRAGSRMGGTLADAGTEGLVENDDVQRTVAAALELFAGPGIRATGSALANYTAEIVAVGALSRAASGEAPMTIEEVHGVRDFLRIIFNGLFEE